MQERELTGPEQAAENILANLGNWTAGIVERPLIRNGDTITVVQSDGSRRAYEVTGGGAGPDTVAVLSRADQMHTLTLRRISDDA